MLSLKDFKKYTKNVNKINSHNLKKIIGGSPAYNWRDGTSFHHPDMTSNSDEELVTTYPQGGGMSDGCAGGRCIDSLYDCGDEMVVWG